MTNKPLIIAHRGASDLAPENTLAAINLAWQLSADAVEIDIHLTSDGHLVVIHDDDTGRIGAKPVAISDQTLAEIRELDAGAWMAPEWAGQKIPMLEEVLATVPDRKRLFIEIKGGPELVPVLKKVLTNSDLKPEQIVIISFSIESVAAAKKMMPDIETSWLSGFGQDPSGAWYPTKAELIGRVKTVGIDGLDLEAKEPVDADLVNQVKSAGLGLYVWTVDSSEHARGLANLGVDGITTNRPDEIAAALKA